MKINQLRKQIDRLDSRLLTLLNQRAKLSGAIGQWKLSSGSHVYAPDREEHLLRTLERKNQGPMPQAALRSIYREILSSSRACQRPLQIACIGQERSNASIATRQRFGSSDHYQTLASLGGIISGLQQQALDIGVVERAAFIGWLWKQRPDHVEVSACGDIVAPAVSHDDQSHNVYLLLSRQPVPPTRYSKTVVAIKTARAFQSVKEWHKSFSVLKDCVLHVEEIKSGKSAVKNRWLVELKGHWSTQDLSCQLEPNHKMIRRWIMVGRYPEVPYYA